ncbi:hypothetical protein Pan44_19410 [Caulifigura coniformis]|uniref:Uncharacterized protein n=1 Tax=Caulifigura coniformis TaxID=2527983 RepID=A0A517SCT0_9PLAN|nr:hypothetical protein [Caulifigura coniformis]QDT53915.1 hypothetical protein Pan44_19410 [Caulifigura coniformis]
MRPWFRIQSSPSAGYVETAASIIVMRAVLIGSESRGQASKMTSN